MSAATFTKGVKRKWGRQLALELHSTAREASDCHRGTWPISTPAAFRHEWLPLSIPESPAITTVPAPSSRHRRGESYAVRAASILDGLHHEYSLMPAGV
jgi:hypothetical protein